MRIYETSESLTLFAVVCSVMSGCGIDLTISDGTESALSDKQVVAPRRELAPTVIGFTDITRSADVAGPHLFGGHGAQFVDVDGNGLVDIYVTRNFEPENMADLFYLNQGDLLFSEDAVNRGIENFDSGSHGAVWADLDNDGDYDLFNGSFDQNRLYENIGNGVFRDITESAGIPSRSLPTRGVIALDMDLDGDLDIFAVSNYRGSNDPYGELNEVYRNDGDLRFSSVPAGDLEAAPAGQGATAVDYDSDGDPDVLAANRSGMLNVLGNDGAGTFRSVDPAAMGLTMPALDGVSFADVNNDGFLDLMLNQHLFFGVGEGRFSLAESFEAEAYHYMAGFGDVDNDGDWDLVFPGRNYVYVNNGTGTFERSKTFSLGAVNDPRSVAFADIDQDGDIDFFYAQKREFNLLIRNDLDSSNRWLKVKLRRSTGQAGAYGARVTVYEAGGVGDPARRIIWREVTSASGYLAQDDQEIHLGVASHQTIDIRVEFPAGAVRDLTGVSSNSTVLVEE